MQVDKILAQQPDAVFGALADLESWRSFAAVEKIYDRARSAKAAARAKEFGIDSVHFGHIEPNFLDVRHISSEPDRWAVTAKNVPPCPRTVLDLLAASEFNSPTAAIYAAEAFSPFAGELRSKYSRFLGSLYTRSEQQRKDIFPVPHQDLTDLILPDSSFDVAIHLEVLEHIPNPARALAELARILRPDGLMLATFPFLWDSDETQRLAEVVDGEIVHLIDKPEYHSDPMDKNGALAYHRFGWDVLKTAKDAGFREANMVFYNSDRGGLFGGDLIGHFVLACRK